MAGSEKFCLRWNDFESNISVAFRDIRDEKDFFDCTLSCGASQIQAHKLILSACSPFFRSILKQNPHQHPLLYLKGVEFTDLQSVLNFMYHGEVNVAQEELNSFLAVAEDLQVKGLTLNSSPSKQTSEPKPDENSATPQPRPRPPKPRQPASPPPPQRTRPAAPPLRPAYQEPDIREVVPVPVVKTEPECQAVSYTAPAVETQGGAVETMEEGFGEEGFEYEGYEGEQYEYMGEEGVQVDMNKDDAIDKQIDNFIFKRENIWTCKECGKTTKNRVTLRNHVEAQHIISPGFQCDICGFVSKTRHALRMHRDNYHKNIQ